MNSFVSFIQKQSCGFVIILFLLSSCSHFSSRTAKNEMKRDLAQAVESSESTESVANPSMESNNPEQLMDLLAKDAPLSPSQAAEILQELGRSQQILDNLIGQIRSEHRTSGHNKLIGRNYIDMIFEIINRGGVEVNLYDLIDLFRPHINSGRDSRGNNLLHLAALHLERFNESNFFDGIMRFRGTPMSYLMSTGIDPTLKNESGETALDIAKSSVQKTELDPSVLEELTTFTEEAEAQRRAFGRSMALLKYHRAVSSEKDMDTVFEVLKRGLEGTTSEFLKALESYLVLTTFQDSRGNTALHFAVSREAVVTVTGELIFSEASLATLVNISDPTIKNKSGKTAVEIAWSNRKLSKGEVYNVQGKANQVIHAKDKLYHESVLKGGCYP